MSVVFVSHAPLRETSYWKMPDGSVAALHDTLICEHDEAVAVTVAGGLGAVVSVHVVIESVIRLESRLMSVMPRMA